MTTTQSMSTTTTTTTTPEMSNTNTDMSASTVSFKTLINGKFIPTRIPVSQVDCICEEATSYHAPSLNGAEGSERIRIATQLLDIQEGLEEVFDDCVPSELGVLMFSTTDKNIIKDICQQFVGMTSEDVKGQDFKGGQIIIDFQNQIDGFIDYTLDPESEDADHIDWWATFNRTYVITADGFLTLQD